MKLDVCLSWGMNPFVQLRISRVCQCSSRLAGVSLLSKSLAHWLPLTSWPPHRSSDPINSGARVCVGHINICSYNNRLAVHYYSTRCIIRHYAHTYIRRSPMPASTWVYQRLDVYTSRLWSAPNATLFPWLRRPTTPFKAKVKENNANNMHTTTLVPNFANMKTAETIGIAARSRPTANMTATAVKPFTQIVD